MTNKETYFKKIIAWFIIIALIYGIISVSHYYISGLINKNIAVSWWNPNRESAEEILDKITEEEFYQNSVGMFEDDYYNDYGHYYLNDDEKSIPQSHLEKIIKNILMLMFVLSMFLMLFALFKRKKIYVVITIFLLFIEIIITPSLLFFILNMLLLLYFSILDLNNQNIDDKRIVIRRRDLMLIYIYVQTCLVSMQDICNSLSYISVFIIIIIGVGILLLIRNTIKKAETKTIIFVVIAILMKDILITIIDSIQNIGGEISLVPIVLSTIMNPAVLIAFIAYFETRKMNMMIPKNTAIIETEYDPIFTTKWFVIGGRVRVVTISILLIFVFYKIVSFQQ